MIEDDHDIPLPGSGEKKRQRLPPGRQAGLADLDRRSRGPRVVLYLSMDGWMGCFVG